MIKRLDRKNYARNEHIEHFTKYVDCSFNITMDIDITSIIRIKEKNAYKFYPMFIYKIAKAVNSIIEMKISKIDEDCIYYFDVVNPAYTVFNEKSKTFSSLWTEYNSDFSIFCKDYLSDVENRKPDEFLGKKEIVENVFSLSSLPWLEYRSFDLIIRNENYLSPIITFGKYFKDKDSYKIPVTVTANHRVLDGYHMHLFFTELSKEWDQA